MQQTCEHLVWGYHEYFRDDVERAAQHLFDMLDLRPSPKAFLVAVRIDESPDSKKACVVPEDNHWLKSSCVYGLLADADRLLANSSEAGTYYFNDEAQALRHLEAKRRYAIRKALCALIDSSPGRPSEVRFFVSPPAERTPFVVFSVLAVRTDILNGVPRLDDNEVRWGLDHRNEMSGSLLESCLELLLERCSASVTQTDAGVDSPLSKNADDLLRAAGLRFFVGLLRRIDQECAIFCLGQATFESIASTAIRTYEGVVPRGHLVMALPEFTGLEPVVKFREPIPLHDARAFRKLLEMTTLGLVLHCNSAFALGLGRLKEPAIPERQRYLKVDFVGRGKWVASFSGIPLMVVQDYRPFIPRPDVEQPLLLDILRRIFPGIEEDAALTIVRYVGASVKPGHGMLIVVAGNAESEATRLGGERIAVVPTMLPETVPQLTLIDGAVLCGPDARCFAIGAILDGAALASGNRGQGARFNSAARYISSQKSPCVAIVVSEDGGVTVLPELRPALKAREIELHFGELGVLVENQSKDWDACRALVDWIEKNQFYFNLDQCVRGNALIKAWDELYKAQDPQGFHAVRRPLKPDPQFDATRDLI